MHLVTIIIVYDIGGALGHELWASLLLDRAAASKCASLCTAQKPSQILEYLGHQTAYK